MIVETQHQAYAKLQPVTSNISKIKTRNLKISVNKFQIFQSTLLLGLGRYNDHHTEFVSEYT